LQALSDLGESIHNSVADPRRCWKLANEESKAMTEIREIRKNMSDQMKNMTNKEIVEFIRKKSAAVEKKYNLKLPRLEEAVK
jgi:hypothetical protein